MVLVKLNIVSMISKHQNLSEAEIFYILSASGFARQALLSALLTAKRFYVCKNKIFKKEVFTMKQYEIVTSHNGNPTVYAENKFQAWEMASEIFTDIIDVKFVKCI